MAAQALGRSAAPAGAATAVTRSVRKARRAARVSALAAQPAAVPSASAELQWRRQIQQPEGAVRLRTRRPQRLVAVQAGRSGSGILEGGEERGQETWHYRVQVPTGMAGIGSQLGGAATLEKGKLEITAAPEQQSSAKLDEGGGGGGLGNNISNGGGGDGDDSDDDAYADDGDEEEGDESFLSVREAVPESFDRIAIEAVLQEWFKTLHSLPTHLRVAVEMGLVSSWQIARFMSVDCRPTLVRAVARMAPSNLSRAFVGRMLADPCFLFKLGAEQIITVGTAAAYEFQQRGSKIRTEWDLALMNVLTLSVANLALVWMMAPCRSYGTVHKSSLQRILHDMPNNMFDREGPLRQYSKVTRGVSALLKGAELSAVGMAAGGIGALASNGLVSLRRAKDPSFEPSLPVPSVQAAATATGLYMGVFSNVRYQLIGGMDRWMQMMLASLPTHLVATCSARFANMQLGEQTRRHWLGLPLEPPVSAQAAGAGMLVAGLAAAKKTRRDVKAKATKLKEAAAGDKKPKKKKSLKKKKKTTTAEEADATPVAA